jgi:replicative DNA helicase
MDLPNAVDAERTLLGAVMEDNAAWSSLGDLSSTDFYRDAHRRIFEVMAELAIDDRPIDLVTVKNALERKQALEACGGAAYVATLIDGLPRISNVGEWVRLVRDAAVRRNVIQAAQRLMHEATSGEHGASDLLDHAQESFSQLAAEGAVVEDDGPDSSLDLAVAQLSSLFTTGEDPARVLTGFTDLDRRLTNLVPGTVTAIAGQTSGGKTAFALHAGDEIAARGKRVLFVSMEMSAAEVQKRRLYREARLPESVYRRYVEAPRDPIAAARIAAAALAKKPLLVREGSFTAAQIARRARAQHRRGLDVLIVDYLGLITPSGEFESTEREINQAARTLKRLAMELGVVVLLLVQLNREGAKTGAAPELFHLRDSGSIEQHCDNVCFLYRDKRDPHGIISLVIRKQRNGPLGTVKLRFIGDTFTFQSYQHADE